MLLVHAGNRVDADDRSSPRFPARNVDDVRARLRRLLGALRPEAVVSAPAAGADLLVLEEAVALGTPIHVVLPLRPTDFEEVSAADRGDEWVRSFRRVLAEARGGPGSVTELDGDPASDWYREANGALLDRARSLAERDGSAVAALAIRPLPGAGEPSVTDDFVTRAEAAGIRVLTLDPGVRTEDMARVLVVMPSGDASEVAGHGRIDRDAVFAKLVVPVLESAGLRWERVDRPGSGVLDDDTAERIATADVVVADLLTSGPDLIDRLRTRVASSRPTFVIGPDGAPPPDGLGASRVLTYVMAGSAMTDREAIDGWDRLADLRASGGSDSTNH